MPNCHGPGYEFGVGIAKRIGLRPAKRIGLRSAKRIVGCDRGRGQPEAMAAKRTDMHRLEELVRLHRKGVGSRAVARMLGMGPNTERRYRQALRQRVCSAVQRLSCRRGRS